MDTDQKVLVEISKGNCVRIAISEIASDVRVELREAGQQPWLLDDQALVNEFVEPLLRKYSVLPYNALALSRLELCSRVLQVLRQS